jgi:cobalt-zinc-cadmium efflux system outer membrane protein
MIMPCVCKFGAAVLLAVFLGTGRGMAQEKLTLEQAIVLAMAGNQEILAAQKDATAARARILQAEAIPDLEIGVGWGETPSDFNIGEAGEMSIGVVQPLEFPGKRKARGTVAKHETRYCEENVERIRHLVRSRVKQVYGLVWLNAKRVAHLEEIAELVDRFQETATMRYQAQKVPFLEVLRARTELSRISIELIDAKGEFQNASAELNRLLGRGGSEPLTLADDLDFKPFPKSLQTVQDEMLSGISTRRMAEILNQRAQAQLFLAGRSLLPDLTLGLFRQTLKDQPPFNANGYFGTEVDGYWQIEIGFTFPLVFWKRPRGETMEARAVLEKSEILRQAIDRNVLTAIQVAYRNVKTAEERVRVYESTLLQDVDDQLQAGIVLYQNGKIDALNLLDILRSGVETKEAYTQAVFDFSAALAELEIAGETEITQ